VVNEITLAEYVYDYLELDAETNASVIARTEKNEVAVRTVTGAGEMLGEVVVSLPGIVASEAVGSRVALVGVDWDDETYMSRYHVLIVDCTDLALPEVVADLTPDFTPWWNWCYWGWGPEIDAVAGKQFADIGFYMPSGGNGDTVLLAGGYLALRGQAETYDAVLGDETPQQGVAVLNVASGEIVHTFGLGFEQVVSLDEAGGMLYLGTKETLPSDVGGRPQCALYISEIDLEGPSIGAAANVPGTFVQYAPDTGVLVLHDWQYSDGLLDWDMTQSLRTVIWEGGDTDTVLAVDEYGLSGYVGGVQGAGSRVYYQRYDEGAAVAAVRVSRMGLLTDGGQTDTGGVWGYLLAGKDATALVTYENAIAVYDFADAPALVQVVDVMGWPSHARFGTNAAYAPLGYAGLAVLPY